MGFKTRRRRQQFSQLPAINLIPMLNVMIAVLGFFVVVSTSLSNEQGIQTDLSGSEEESGGKDSTDIANDLIIKLDQEQFLVDNKAVTEQQVLVEAKAYLAKNQEGKVLLGASNQVPYEKVMQLLGELRALDKTRVVLNIDSDGEQATTIETEGSFAEEDFED